MTCTGLDRTIAYIRCINRLDGRKVCKKVRFTVCQQISCQNSSTWTRKDPVCKPTSSQNKTSLEGKVNFLSISTQLCTTISTHLCTTISTHPCTTISIHLCTKFCTAPFHTTRKRATILIHRNTHTKHRNESVRTCSALACAAASFAAFSCCRLKYSSGVR